MVVPFIVGLASMLVADLPTCWILYICFSARLTLYSPRKWTWGSCTLSVLTKWSCTVVRALIDATTINKGLRCYAAVQLGQMKCSIVSAHAVLLCLWINCTVFQMQELEPPKTQDYRARCRRETLLVSSRVGHQVARYPRAPERLPAHPAKDFSSLFQTLAAVPGHGAGDRKLSMTVSGRSSPIMDETKARVPRRHSSTSSNPGESILSRN